MTDYISGAARAAGEQGPEVARHAGSAAADVATTAREQVGNVAREAAGQARNVAQDVRQRVTGEAEEQAKKVSRQLVRIADELTSMADGQSEAITAGPIRQVADAGRQAAAFLDERGARGLLDSAQGFARRNPWSFVLGAVGAGFLVGRVVKGLNGPQESDSPRRPTGADAQFAEFAPPAPEQPAFDRPATVHPVAVDPTPAGYVAEPVRPAGAAGQNDDLFVTPDVPHVGR